MQVLSRNKVDRVYESLIECYRKANEFHDSICSDDESDAIFENFSNYKRQMPLNMLEEIAFELEDRNNLISIFGTNDARKAHLLNGFLSRPGLLSCELESNFELPVLVTPSNVIKQNKLEIIYKDVSEYITDLLKVDELKEFLKPYQAKIEADPASVQEVFNDYLSAVDTSSEVEDVEVHQKDFIDNGHDIVKEYAVAISSKFNLLGRTQFESFEQRNLLNRYTKFNMAERSFIKELKVIIDNVVLKDNNVIVKNYSKSFFDNTGSDEAKVIFKNSTANVFILDINDLTDPAALKSLKKMFAGEIDKNCYFIVDGFEKLLREDVTQELLDNIVKNLCSNLGFKKFEIKRILFASSFRIFLSAKMSDPQLASESELQYEELVRQFHEKKQGLNKSLEPIFLEKLRSVYSDGGIAQLRNGLLDFISIELLLSRCIAAKDQLYLVSDMINKVVLPEKNKVKDFMTKGNDPIDKVLEPVSSAFGKIDHEYSASLKDANKILGKLNVKIKNKISKSFKNFDSQALDNLIKENGMLGTKDILPLLIEDSKNIFSSIFTQIINNELKALVRSKFISFLEKKIMLKRVKAFDETFEAKYSEFYEYNESAFIAKLNWIIETKAYEASWEINKLKVIPKIEDEWTTELFNNFKSDIQTFYSNRYAKAVDTVFESIENYLHYFYQQYKDNTEKLIVKIRDDILKNLNNKKQESKSLYARVRKHLKLTEYVVIQNDLEKKKQEVDLSLNKL
ncbi:MAG: hypothetical protein COA79_11530 [Planctomycetota bacterium]|nr:MAG: hypothetical protein COA79_11530 [Planctomycetota bacterium]